MTFVLLDAGVTAGKVMNSAMILFTWKNSYAWPRKPLVAQNVVATSQPLAAQAWLKMLPLRIAAVTPHH